MLFRRNTAAAAAVNNRVLQAGEPGAAIDVGAPVFKIGDGVTPWNTLPYPNVAVVAERYDVRRSGVVADGTTNDATALQAALTVAADATKGAAWLPAGTIRCNAGITIPAALAIYGVPNFSVLSFVGVITDAISITSAGPVHLQGFRLTGSGGAVNGVVSAYAGGSTSYRHKFIDMNASAFTGRGFAAYNTEHALWERCFAYACGVGFFADQSLTQVAGSGVQNEWRQCRAQDCTSHGFDIQDQIQPRLIDVEALNCAGDGVLMRGNTFTAEISADTERPSGTAGIGLNLSGSRHTVWNLQANQLATALQVTGSLFEIHQVRAVNCTNGVVYSSTADARNTVHDPLAAVFDPDAALTGNRRAGDGGFRPIVHAQAANVVAYSYTVRNEAVLLADTTVATTSYTVNLRTAVGRKGEMLTVRRTAGTTAAVLDANGTQTIDGSLTVSVTTTPVTIVSDGANWVTV